MKPSHLKRLLMAAVISAVTSLPSFAQQDQSPQETPTPQADDQQRTERPSQQPNRNARLAADPMARIAIAVDRNNEAVAGRYDELHPSVLELLTDTIEVCRDNDVATSICGQAASKPAMIDRLVEAGISSISVNVDAVHDAQREAKRVEQHLILESVRE